MLKSINPATGKLLKAYEEHSAAEVDAMLDRSRDAFGRTRRTGMDERGAWLSASANLLRERRDEYALMITREMGKPIGEARAEVEKCAWACEFYAAHGAEFLQPEPRRSSATESYVAYEPIGPVLGVMPWNFPFWQVFRFAAPALMAGNTCILKHASNVTGCALAVEAVLREGGFAEGAFQAMKLPSSAMQGIAGDDRIAAVSVTGSEKAGSAIASEAGRTIKKTVLELGGSDPFVVLEDADLEAAVATAIDSRYRNAGQSCIAAKRFILIESIADEFEARLVQAVGALEVGNPEAESTQVGPLAREDLLESLQAQVDGSVSAGAVVAVGGRRLEAAGAFYAPTVLTGVEPGMPAADEETFGPVAAVMRARDRRHAVSLANATRYGLGATIWTRDTEGAKKLAREIEAGSVFVNGMVSSDPRLPFGGVKRSGYGRELSEPGIREFVNIQTVWIGPASQP